MEKETKVTQLEQCDKNFDIQSICKVNTTKPLMLYREDKQVEHTKVQGAKAFGVFQVIRSLSNNI